MRRAVALSSLLLLLLRPAAAEEDHCTCLNWKETYDKELVFCGEGREFNNDTVTLAFAYHGKSVLGVNRWEAICGTYHKMDNNYCLNYKLHSYTGDESVTTKERSQWCYVDSRCQNLNGGRKVPDKDSIPTWIPSFMNSQKTFDWVNENLHFPRKIERKVSLKICDRKQDTLTRDMNPLELMAMGQKYDMRIGSLTMMAYSLVKNPYMHWPLWQNVSELVGKGDIAGMPDYLQEAIKKKDPLIYETDSHHGDDSQRIIVGKELYKLNSQCPVRDADNHCPPKTMAKDWEFKRGLDMGESMPGEKKASSKRKEAKGEL